MNQALARIEVVTIAVPRPAEPDPRVEGVLAVLDRLQAVIDHESEQLARQAAVDLAELNRHKRQGMLELTRALRSFGANVPEPVRVRLADLASSLERNRAVLDVQLAAVREIADIIADVMRDAEWDGTYSMRALRA